MLSQLVTEHRSGNLGKCSGALGHGLAPQLCCPELGDDYVELMPRRGDDRARLEEWLNARHLCARNIGLRFQAYERPVGQLESRARDEVLVASDARELAAADGVGDDLAVQVDRNRSVNRHDVDIGGDDFL